MESMERLKGKKILITGGAGFIGSHLAAALIKKHAEVFIIDIRIDPKSFFAFHNLSDKVHIDLVDIRNKKKVMHYFDTHSFDFVFHLAAEAIVTSSYDSPYTAFETNIMGTVNILEAIRKHAEIKGVIVASSDKAYGKTVKAYKEDFPLKGDHPYDVSKSSADLICQAYYTTYNLPVVITRFGNVIGEGDIHFDRIIPGICKAIIRNESLALRSDGTYIRDYLYVKDVVEGYICLLKHINTIHGEAFNFSSSDTLSVLDLIKKIEKITGKEIKYKIYNTAKNEIPYQHLDSTKVKRIQWKPMYTIDSAFLKILKWYTSYFNFRPM